MINAAADHGSMATARIVAAFALGAVVGAVALFAYALASIIPTRGWE